MSNSVGKAREHERWKRRQDEDAQRVQILWKRETDDELKARIITLTKGRWVRFRDLGPLLRLRIVDQFRLKDLLVELRKSRLVRLETVEGHEMISAISDPENVSGLSHL